MTLEDQMLDDIRAGKQVDIERALLIVSGCKTEEGIAKYKAKLDYLDAEFRKYNRRPLFKNNFNEEIAYIEETDPEAVASNLHEFLWNRRGKGYDEIETYDFAKGLNAQLGDARGYCAFHSACCLALGLRNGLEMQVLNMPWHVAVRVIDNGRKIDIETTEKNGFNWQDYTNIRGRPPKAIIADMLYNRGNAKARMGETRSAIRDYKKALKIIPEHTNARFAMDLSKQMLGRINSAVADFVRYGLLRRMG